MRTLALCACTALLACGSPKSSAPHDGMPATDGVPGDGPLIDGPHADASTSCPPGTPACATPPTGSTLCGSGTIDVAAGISACNSLDPPLDLGEGVAKACSTFTPVHGTYAVYCGTSVYLWIGFDDASSTDVDPCPHSVMLPDGGVVTGNDPSLRWDASGNPMAFARVTGGGATGGGPISTPRGRSDGMILGTSTWHGNLEFDGTTASVGASHEMIHATVYPAMIPVNCDDIPTGNNTIVIAAPVTWTVP